MKENVHRSINSREFIFYKFSLVKMFQETFDSKLMARVQMGVCGPQGDLRRMWSEPFHAKTSSSRFLEV